jgi:hypothetical protein
VNRRRKAGSPSAKTTLDESPSLPDFETGLTAFAQSQGRWCMGLHHATTILGALAPAPVPGPGFQGTNGGGSRDEDGAAGCSRSATERGSGFAGWLYRVLSDLFALSCTDGFACRFCFCHYRSVIPFSGEVKKCNDLLTNISLAILRIPVYYRDQKYVVHATRVRIKVSIT